MSLLSKAIKGIGKGVSKVVEPVKKVVKAVVPDSIEHIVNTNVRGLGRTVGQAAPLVGLIPGVGTALAAGIGGLSSLAAGGSLNDNLNAAGKSALGNVAGDAIGGGLSKLGGAISSIPGASSVGSVISKIPGASQVGDFLGIGGDAIGGAIPDSALGIGGVGGSGISLGSLLGTAGKFLGGNGGLNALGVAQGVSSVLDQKKANDYANKAIGNVEGSYNEREPLRAQGLAGLLNPQTADLSNLSNIAGGLKAPTLTPGAQIGAESLRSIQGNLDTSRVMPEAQQDTSSLQSIQGGLDTSRVQPGAIQDASSLRGIQGMLGGVKPPTPGALQRFQPPMKPSPASVQALLNDAGNPYSRGAAA